MANQISRILMKRSAIASHAPLAEDLQFGELSLNYNDKRLYFLDSNSEISFFDANAIGKEGGTIDGDLTVKGTLTATASKASALTSGTVGGETQPVYFKDGVPVETTYQLNATVPADAKFTDTTYSVGSDTTAGIAKLYSEVGTATDGAMTQAAMKSALDTKADASEVLLKTEQTLTDEEKEQVRENLRFVGKNVSGQEFTIDGETVTASESAEIIGDYDNNIATGQWSIAEGSQTIATGVASHAEGRYTIANGSAQHVEGVANIADTEDKYVHIAGNGTTEERSNAHTLDWEGNAWFAGDVYVGSTSGKDKDEGSKKVATEDYVQSLYKKLNTNTVLGFYCIEDVTIVTNGIPTVHPANSNVEVKFIEDDTWEIIPTSNNSILTLNAFPGALGTFYPWLEGVKQFSNILFDMNSEEMYTKWNQGNQGAYQVQYAQYTNCIFWSDLDYVSDVAKRTNYTLYYSAQIPLCYSHNPDNTFKSFYLAFNVNSDPNWGNKTYRESFAKATWPTQAFSYYGGRTIGIFDHDNVAFNIPLPKDCRGLMYAATAVENAGVFDATNTTNFGAKSGSWRDAFGFCKSLRNLYIKNLKVSLNVSWSPLNYDSIYFIISEATNTNRITISLSPYTYNLLRQSDFELATSKNITLELLTTNYVEDTRLSAITISGDGSKVLSDDGTYKTLPVKTSQLENDSSFVSSNELASIATSGNASDLNGTVAIANGGTGASTAAEALVNLGITATAEELNYVDGVTSNVQTQLNGKLETTGTAAKATADASGNTITETYATKTEVSNLGDAIVDGFEEFSGAIALSYASNEALGALEVRVASLETRMTDVESLIASFADNYVSKADYQAQIDNAYEQLNS